MVSSRIATALHTVGARLKRQKKHLVYELPNGKNVVVSKTPSDRRSEQNTLRDIAKVAGVEKAEKIASKPRRPKPGRPEPTWTISPNAGGMAAALSSSGIVEKQLRAEKAGLERRIVTLEKELRLIRSSYGYRIEQWVERLLSRKEG